MRTAALGWIVSAALLQPALVASAERDAARLEAIESFKYRATGFGDG